LQTTYQKDRQNNPRDGESSPFERIYQLYVDGPGVSQLASEYEAAVKENPGDANAHLVLAHVYKKLGREQQMLSAYRKAVRLSPEHYYFRLVLGRTYLSLRQYDNAIAQLEKAASLKPKERTPIYADDLLDIYKSLGKAYLRRNQPEDAIKSWKKIAELEPENVYSRLELADLFVEQELYAEAIEEHKAIIELKKTDPGRVCKSWRDIGKIYELMGEYEEAMGAYEQILEKTAPGNWLRKEVRARTIAIYMRQNNLSGLVKYYQERLKTNPIDPELLGLLAEAYVENGQLQEAIETYQKALKHSPGDIELRLSLIRILQEEKRYQETVREYEILIEGQPNQVEIYRDFGALYLEMEQPEEAKTIWERFAQRRPNDATTQVIAADIYKLYDFPDEAIAHYEKAVELAPGQVDYLDALGELHFKQGNLESAISTWNKIVEDKDEPKAAAANYSRLAEVLLRQKNKRGEPRLLDEALAAMKKSVELAPKDFQMRQEYAQTLLEAEKYDAAFKQFEEGAKIASSDLLRTNMEDGMLEVYKRQGVLAEKIRELESKKDNDYKRYMKIARMYAKYDDMNKAKDNLARALELAPEEVHLLQWQAELYKIMGRLAESIEVNNRLVKLDKENAREYYIAIAQLNNQLNRKEEARAAMNQAIAKSPRDPEGYRLLANMESRWGYHDVAIEQLKKAIKLERDSTDLRAELARVYRKAEMYRPASEQYWACFRMGKDAATKLSFAKPLIDVYSEMDKLDELREQFTLMSHNRSAGVLPLLALAQLDEYLGNLAAAQEKVAQALDKQPMQPEILREMVRLSVEQSNIIGAIEYQRYLAEVEPSDFSQTKLGELLLEAGHKQEAISAWNKLLEGEVDAKDYLNLAQLMAKNDLVDETVATLKNVPLQKTDDSGILYGVGAIYMSLSKPELARPYFKQLLSFPVEYKRKPKEPPTYDELLKVLRCARDLEAKITGGQPWHPRSLAELQAGALVWLDGIYQQEGALDDFEKELLADAQTSPKDAKPMLWLAGLHLLRRDDDAALGMLADVAHNPNFPNDARVRGAVLSLAKQIKSDSPESLDKYIDIAMSGPIDDADVLKGFFGELVKMKKTGQAEELLEKSVKIPALSTLQNWFPSAYIQIASSYIEQNTTKIDEKSWHLIAPFDNPQTTNNRGEGFAKTYPPENEINLAKIYQGKSGEVKWIQKVDSNPEDNQVNLEEIFGMIEWAVAYAYTTFNSPAEQSVTLQVASDDDVIIWLNGALVHSNEIARGMVKPDEVAAFLKSGENQLLVKICNRTLNWAFSVAYQTKPQSEEADRLIVKAMSLKIDDADAFKSFFGELIKLGKLKEAEETLERSKSDKKLVDLQDWHPAAYLMLAQAHHGLGHKEDTEKFVNLALALAITKPKTLQGCFDTLVKLGNRKEAESLLDKYSTSPTPEGLQSWYPTAYLQLAKGEFVRPREADWWIIGPFDNSDRKGLATEYPPDKEINLNATYPGVGGDVKWAQRTDKNPDDGVIDLAEIFETQEKYTAYAWQTFESLTDQTILFDLHGDDDTQVKVNGVEVYRHDDDASEGVAPAPLKAGKNEIFVKVCNRVQYWSFIVGYQTEENKRNYDRLIAQAESLSLKDQGAFQAYCNMLIQLGKLEYAQELIEKSASMKELQQAQGSATIDLQNWYPSAYLQLSNAHKSKEKGEIADKMLTKALSMPFSDGKAFQDFYNALVKQKKLKEAESLLDKAVAEKSLANIQNWYPNAYLQLAERILKDATPENDKKEEDADKLI